MNRAERLDAQPPVGVDCCAGAANAERPLHADVGVQSLPRRQFCTVHTLLDGCQFRAFFHFLPQFFTDAPMQNVYNVLQVVDFSILP
jgi:hypothetical protein